MYYPPHNSHNFPIDVRYLLNLTLLISSPLTTMLSEWFGISPKTSYLINEYKKNIKAYLHKMGS